MTIEFSHEQKFHFKFELEIEGFTCTKRQDNDTWESMHVTKGEGTRTNSVLPVECTSSDKGMQMTT